MLYIAFTVPSVLWLFSLLVKRFLSYKIFIAKRYDHTVLIFRIGFCGTKTKFCLYFQQNFKPKHFKQVWYWMSLKYLVPMSKMETGDLYEVWEPEKHQQLISKHKKTRKCWVMSNYEGNTWENRFNIKFPLISKIHGWLCQLSIFLWLRTLYKSCLHSQLKYRTMIWLL